MRRMRSSAGAGERPIQQHASPPYPSNDERSRQRLRTPLTGAEGFAFACPEWLERRRRLITALTFELMDLLTYYPYGIWTSDIMRRYRHRYGRELDLGLYGWTHIGQMVHELNTSAFNMLRPEPLGYWWLYDVNLPMPVHPFLVEVNILPAIVTSMWCNQHFEMMLGVAQSPSHLWLVRCDLYRNLSDLVGDMSAYYSRTGPGADRSLAAEAIVNVGMFCVAEGNGYYHRVRIVRDVEPGIVIVRFIDYGILRCLEVADLKPMLIHWTYLPAMAIRARLAGVRPVDGAPHWSDHENVWLTRILWKRIIQVNVVDVDTTNNILEVWMLYEYTNCLPCLKTVNQMMVYQRYAEARPDSTLCDHVSPYLQPSFDMLENDIPSYGSY